MKNDRKYYQQIKEGDHPQFVFDTKKENVVCRCGHSAVHLKGGFLCGTITAYPCEYNKTKSDK